VISGFSKLIFFHQSKIKQNWDLGLDLQVGPCRWRKWFWDQRPWLQSESLVISDTSLCFNYALQSSAFPTSSCCVRSSNNTTSENKINILLNRNWNKNDWGFSDLLGIWIDWIRFQDQDQNWSCWEKQRMIFEGWVFRNWNSSLKCRNTAAMEKMEDGEIWKQKLCCCLMINRCCLVIHVLSLYLLFFDFFKN
jgi:hypothetical protein